MRPPPLTAVLKVRNSGAGMIDNQSAILMGISDRGLRTMDWDSWIRGYGKGRLAARESVTLSVGNPICPYGIAYRRGYGLSHFGSFKKPLWRPLWGASLGGVMSNFVMSYISWDLIIGVIRRHQTDHLPDTASLEGASGQGHHPTPHSRPHPPDPRHRPATLRKPGTPNPNLIYR